MKPTFWQRLGYAVGSTPALTACFAVISVILWIIAQEETGEGEDR